MRGGWFVLALLLGGAGGASAQPYPLPPTELPFDVSRKENRLEVGVRIIEDRTYYIDLQFSFRDRGDQDRVSKLVGDASRARDGRYGGIDVPIQLEIFSLSGTKDWYRLFKGTLLTEGIHAQGASHYSRTIADVRLIPGTYQIRIMTIFDIPEFSGTPTRLRVGYDPRFGTFR